MILFTGLAGLTAWVVFFDMSELPNQIKLAFEREITRSMKESRFLREIQKSRERHGNFVVSAGDGTFPVLESADIPPIDTTVKFRTEYRTLSIYVKS